MLGASTLVSTLGTIFAAWGSLGTMELAGRTRGSQSLGVSVMLGMIWGPQFESFLDSEELYCFCRACFQATFRMSFCAEFLIVEVFKTMFLFGEYYKHHVPAKVFS